MNYSSEAKVIIRVLISEKKSSGVRDAQNEAEIKTMQNWAQEM